MKLKSAVLVALLVMGVIVKAQFCPTTVHPQTSQPAIPLCNQTFTGYPGDGMSGFAICDADRTVLFSLTCPSGHQIEYTDVTATHKPTPSAPYWQFVYNGGRNGSVLHGKYVNGVFNFINYPQANSYATFTPR